MYSYFKLFKTLVIKAFLIPWSGGAFLPLGPFFCPTTEEKKWPIAPKPGPQDLYWVNEFNIDKKFKKQKKLRFFLNVFSECRKCYFRAQISKISWGGDIPPALTPLANSCLWYSVHTFGYRILCWGRARKMGPFAVFPYHWRILKKCTARCRVLSDIKCSSAPSVLYLI